MPKITAVCYLFSLLFYGMGSSKMSVLNVGHLDAYAYTAYVFQATVYSVLTIFLIVVGTSIFYIKIINNDIKLRVKAGRRSDNKKRVSVPKVKTQLVRLEYSVDLDRRMSS